MSRESVRILRNVLLVIALAALTFGGSFTCFYSSGGVQAPTTRFAHEEN